MENRLMFEGCYYCRSDLLRIACASTAEERDKERYYYLIHLRFFHGASVL